MILRILRHSALPTLLAAAITPACSNNQAPAKALVVSYLQQSSAAQCPFASRQPWLQVGVETGSDPTLVADGDPQAGGNVSVNCSVHPDGSGFDINLNASLSGLMGATVYVASNSPVTSMGGMGITGTFEGMGGLNFTSDNCVLTYVYENGPIPNSPPIAPGRIWGHISCLDAHSNRVSNVDPDGGTTPQSCDGEADIIFTNCGT